MIVILMYRYVLWMVYLLGSIGHLLNIYIFNRSCFRSNPCSIYFLASALANVVMVWIFIPLRSLQYGFRIDPRLSSFIFCKFYSFINDSTMVLLSWILIFACLDRYCRTSSNIGIRQLSSVPNARLIISRFTIFILLVHIHIFLYYTIDHRMHKCTTSAGIYQTFYIIYHLLMNIVCPVLFMCVFGLLTMNNICQERKRISAFMIEVVYNNPIIRKKRRIDNQIYRMLFIQCFIYILMLIPFSINHIYSILNEKNNIPFEIISLFISLIGHSMTFYCFLFSSQLFRREVIKFGKKTLRIFSI